VREISQAAASGFSIRGQVTFIAPVFTLAADQVIQREFVIPMLRPTRRP